METLKQTPLNDHHIALKARMMLFGGWNMPLQYQGILAEHQACRKQAALFDISHMGEFLFKGDVESSGLDRLITCTLKDIPLKTCRYGLLLNEDAGILDDLIVFRLASQEYLLVVNAANTEKDFSHLKKNLKSENCIEDQSMQLGKLDIQGPLAREILTKEIPGIERLKYYCCDVFPSSAGEVLISRTGYTGELGYEIFLPWEKTKILWEKILKNDNVKPAGLGARDVLRIEMGYSLYGHEISADILPSEAGLTRFLDFSKDFIGKAALCNKHPDHPQRKIIYFESLTRRAPRPGQRIFDAQGQDRGFVTSGTFSPVLQKGIGIALATCQEAVSFDTMFFGDEIKKDPGRICERPFYKNGTLKS